MFTFVDLQNEVKRRATKDQGGTQFNTAVKNVINTSLFRVGREASWRVLRRKSYFTTETSYTTGTGAASVTNGSKSVTVTGATFITDNIKIGRRIKFGGSAYYYTIRTITGETTLTIDKNYDGTTSAVQSYSILPTEEYNLPIQAGHRMFMWHNAYGYPYKLTYVTDQDFRGSGVCDTNISVPTNYRMWGEDMVIEQPLQASVMRIASSSSADTSIQVTVFGVVSGYPDYETITTNASDGTTAASGSKSFTSIERVIKSASTTGRITVDCNSANTTVAVLPVGDTTGGIMYRKVQLWPLPDAVDDIYVQYYKDPYRLVNDNDVHEMGQDFDEAIILLATSKLKYEQDQAEGDKFLLLYKDEVKNLKKTNADKIDWLPTLQRDNSMSNRGGLIHNQLGYNQLGGNYGPMVGR